MTIKHFNLDDGKVLFKISILKNYSEIHVCVRDGMHFIRNDEINTIKYIYFEQFTILENHISYYNNNTIWNDQFPFTESPLYKFCNYVVKNNTNSPIFLKYAFKGFLNEKTLRRREQILPLDDDFYQVIQNLPGYVYLIYQNISINP